jgi:hypothetical protein
MVSFIIKCRYNFTFYWGKPCDSQSSPVLPLYHNVLFANVALYICEKSSRIWNANLILIVSIYEVTLRGSARDFHPYHVPFLFSVLPLSLPWNCELYDFFIRLFPAYACRANNSWRLFDIPALNSGGPRSGSRSVDHCNAVSICPGKCSVRTRESLSTLSTIIKSFGATYPMQLSKGHYKPKQQSLSTHLSRWITRGFK